MSAQHSEWRSPAVRHPTIRIPDSDQCIRASTGHLRAIGTPVDVVERGRVALYDAQALSTCHVPQTDGAIVTAAEQAAAVGHEGQAVHRGGMSLQRRPGAALLDIPQPTARVPAPT